MSSYQYASIYKRPWSQVLKDYLRWFERKFYEAVHPDRYFVLDKKSYTYFSRPYNRTWKNERGVEISIIMDFLNKIKNKRVLEFGNVLRHYFNLEHDVVDKYEVNKGILNVDIIDYQPKDLYDAIFSISTLEHVGWDELPQDPPKLINAVNKLISLLLPSGQLILTVPIGYNTYLDNWLRNKSFPWSSIFFLKRISTENDWIQVEDDSIWNVRYNQPYICANGIAVCYYKN